MSKTYHCTKDGKVLRRVQSALAVAFAETGDRVQVIEPIATPICAPISYEQWRQMLAFFLWSNKEHKGEAQVSGFLHRETGAFHLEPFWQESVGMTTRELPREEPRQAALWADLGARGYHEIVFTGHHHCSASAFQSGTDLEDEFKNKPQGFHITIGKLDESTYDLHVRAKFVVMGTFDQTTGEVLTKGWSGMMPFEITDLVQMPIPHEQLIKMPAALRKSIAEHYLLAASRTDETFPDHWKERVLKPVPVARSYTEYGSWNPRGWSKNGVEQPAAETYALGKVLDLIEELDALAGDEELGAVIGKAMADPLGGHPELLKLLSPTPKLIHLRDALTIYGECCERRPDMNKIPPAFVEALSEAMREVIDLCPNAELRDAYKGNHANELTTLLHNAGLSDVAHLIPDDVIQKAFDDAYRAMLRDNERSSRHGHDPYEYLSDEELRMYGGY